MTEKRFSVHLPATGHQAIGDCQGRAELEAVGDAGARVFGWLTREMGTFWRRAGIAAAAATARWPPALLVNISRVTPCRNRAIFLHQIYFCCTQLFRGDAWTSCHIPAPLR